MPVSELMKQDAAQIMRLDLADTTPDYWGTDDPITLVVQLPVGELKLRQVDHLGVFVHSSPNSIDGTTEAMSRVRSISAPILSGMLTLPQEIGTLVDYCENLRNQLGSSFRLDTERSVDLGKPETWMNHKKINACAYRAAGKYVTVGIEKHGDSNRYFSRVNLGEDIS